MKLIMMRLRTNGFKGDEEMSEMFVLDLNGFENEGEAKEFLNKVFSSAKFKETQGMAVFELSEEGKKNVTDALKL